MSPCRGDETLSIKSQNLGIAPCALSQLSEPVKRQHQFSIRVATNSKLHSFSVWLFLHKFLLLQGCPVEWPGEWSLSIFTKSYFLELRLLHLLFFNAFLTLPFQLFCSELTDQSQREVQSYLEKWRRCAIKSVIINWPSMHLFIKCMGSCDEQKHVQIITLRLKRLFSILTWSVRKPSASKYKICFDQSWRIAFRTVSIKNPIFIKYLSDDTNPTPFLDACLQLVNPRMILKRW